MYSNLADGGGGDVLLFFERAGNISSSGSAPGARRPVKVDDDIDGPKTTVDDDAQQLRGAAETCAEGRADSAPGSRPLQLGCSVVRLYVYVVGPL
jgi:hypothetical protein